MKNVKVFFTIILLTIASAVSGQSVTATLGGNSSSDYFDVEDNSGNILFRINGEGKTGIGTTTLAEALNVNGNLNLAIDGEIQFDQTTVFFTPLLNTFIGMGAGHNLDSGDNNTFVGNSAGYNIDDGDNNVFVGKNAGYNNVDASYNTFIGYLSGKANVSGERNTFLGALCGRDNIDGQNNTFVGFDAGLNNESGGSNVLIGYYAGGIGTSLSNNVIIGYSAGKNTTGSGNVFLGYSAGREETGSNLLYIDNSSTTTPLIYGDFNADELTINGDLTVTGTITELSDRRYKTEIEPVKNTLQKIEKINAVYYKWDKEKYPNLVVSNEREIGVIAQDVEKVFPELVKTDDKGFKSVNYAKLSAVLLQVVKEQQERIENLEKKYSEQNNAIYELTKAFVSLQKENEIKMSSNIK